MGAGEDRREDETRTRNQQPKAKASHQRGSINVQAQLFIFELSVIPFGLVRCVVSHCVVLFPCFKGALRPSPPRYIPPALWLTHTVTVPPSHSTSSIHSPAPPLPPVPAASAPAPASRPAPLAVQAHAPNLPDRPPRDDRVAARLDVVVVHAPLASRPLEVLAPVAARAPVRAGARSDGGLVITYLLIVHDAGPWPFSTRPQMTQARTRACTRARTHRPTDPPNQPRGEPAVVALVELEAPARPLAVRAVFSKLAGVRPLGYGGCGGYGGRGPGKGKKGVVGRAYY